MSVLDRVRDEARALRGVPDCHPVDRRLAFRWMSLPGRQLPPSEQPHGDPWSDDPDDHGGWRPVWPH